MMQTVLLSVIALLVAVVVPCVLGECPAVYPHCRHQQDWHIGADRVRPSGVAVHGHANTPSHSGVQGTVHGSRVVGGPHNGAQTVGGGLSYQHGSGVHAGVDASHTRGQGTTYTAGVGGSTKVGPGTLSVGGGAAQYPGSSKVQGQVGATYTVPLP